MTPLLYLVIAWLAGLWLAAQLPLSWPAWLAVAGFAGLGGVMAWRRPGGWRLAALCALCVAGAGVRLTATRHDLNDPGHLTAYTGLGLVTVEGVVNGEIVPRATTVQTRLRVERLTLRGGTTVTVQGDLLVYLPPLSLSRQSATGEAAYQYGDRLRLIGSLVLPPQFETFDYRRYLAAQGVEALLVDAHAEFVAADQGHPLRAALLAVKARSLSVLRRVFPEPHASLLAGILLGDESGLSDDLQQAFQATGASHIIAISGFNIAILVGLLGLVTRRFLGHWRGFAVTVVVIAIYTVLVGAGASVLRAAVMGSLGLLAGQVGRRAHGLNALAASALVLTLLDPLALWDAGFQLSAAATLGLIVYSRRLETGFQQWVERFAPPGTARQATAVAAELVLATIAAQLTTLPLLIYHFRTFSLSFLLANTLIVPLQPFVMVGGGLALVCGLAWPALGQVVAWLVWPFTAYTLAVVEGLARVPGAALYLGEVAAPLVALYYVGLAALTLWRNRPPPPANHLPAHPHRAPATGLLLFGSAALVLWGWTLSLPPADGRLRVTLLDLGAPAEYSGGGEAVLVQTPSGATMLIGGGPAELPLARALDRNLPLFTRHLDLLVVASPTDQHLGALPNTVRRYSFDRVLLTGAPGGGAAYRVLLNRLQDQQVEVVNATGLPPWDLGDGLTLRVLADDDQGSVLRLDYERFSLVIAPRVDATAEAELISLGLAQPTTALLAARSGAATATSEAWLRALNPWLVLLSAGAGQPGAAAPEVLARLAGRTLLRTDISGDIRLETDGLHLWVTTDR